MKYVITESRLKEFIDTYLNSFVNTKVVSFLDSLIVISEKAVDYEDADWIDYIEYDYQDGRLWVYNYLLKIFGDLFNLDVEESFEFIKEWFETRFQVEVNYLTT